MQSEFACHIGSMGKFFCRVCHVKGTDAKGKAPISVPIPGQDPEHIEADDAHTDAPQNNLVDPDHAEDADAPPNNPNGIPAAAPGKGKKKPETLEEMIERVTRFMKVCRDYELRAGFSPDSSPRLGSLGQNRIPVRNYSTCSSWLSRLEIKQK